MELSDNEKFKGVKNEDLFNKMLSRRDELLDIKAQRDVLIEQLSGYQEVLKDLYEPVSKLQQAISEEMNQMEETQTFLDFVENTGINAHNQYQKCYIDCAEKQQNIIQSKEDQVSMRTDQLNDVKNKLNDLENDAEQKENEILDLENSIAAATANLQQQREILKELSLVTYNNQIAEKQDEYRRLQTECWQLDQNVNSANLELRSLDDKNKSLSENLLAQETEHCNHLSKLDNVRSQLKDIEKKYGKKLNKNERVMLKLKSIEQKREDEINNLKFKISQWHEMCAKLQSEYEEITNKMNDEFGGAESFDYEQNISEAEQQLANWDVKCNAVDDAMNKECNRKIEIDKKESKLLEAENKLKQKIEEQTAEQLSLLQLNLPTQNEQTNQSDISIYQHHTVYQYHTVDQHETFDTEHEFTQPIVLEQNVRRIRRSRNQRSLQQLTKTNFVDMPDSSISESSPTSQASQVNPNILEQIHRNRKILDLYRQHHSKLI